MITSNVTMTMKEFPNNSNQSNMLTNMGDNLMDGATTDLYLDPLLIGVICICALVIFFVMCYCKIRNTPNDNYEVTWTSTYLSTAPESVTVLNAYQIEKKSNSRDYQSKETEQFII
ncbi:uncharacterized protein LOC134694489 [Mytilus trossulus]|uniref:uncharacterized protein LOC134694489 n=1 Tax=Mytilus trossulus TaxID=6551 RepID=UPI0030051B88